MDENQTVEIDAREVVVGPGPVPAVIAFTHPDVEGDIEFILLNYVLDDDGTGCAVVGLRDGRCARVDYLQQVEGFIVKELRMIRAQSPILAVPNGR